MKIPKRFEMFGSTINVVRRKDLLGSCTAGLWESDSQRISIATGLTPDQAQHAFVHEFFHAALEACGEHKLSADEKFVDTLAGLTVQMLKSAR